MAFVAAKMIEMTEMSEKFADVIDNEPLADVNNTCSELSTNSKPTEANLDLETVRAEGRRKRWRLIEAIIDWRRCLRKKPEEVKRRIRHGLPDWFRALVWQLISGGRDILTENPSLDYGQLISQEISEFDKLRIVKDIPRTLKCLGLSQTYSGSLYNVLKAYDVYHRSRAGYIQGMSYIAGLLLVYLRNEESTFWTMVAVLNKPEMRDIYSEYGPLLQQYLFQFGMLVKKQLPRLDRHFEEQRIVPSMYARSWFLTIFSADLPIPLVVRIWDVFLYEGINIIFQVGLALLKSFETVLLRLTKESLIEFLVTMKGRRGFQPDVLLHMALSFDVQNQLPELEIEYHQTSITLQKFLIFEKEECIEKSRT